MQRAVEYVADWVERLSGLGARFGSRLHPFCGSGVSSKKRWCREAQCGFASRVRSGAQSGRCPQRLYAQGLASGFFVPLQWSRGWPESQTLRGLLSIGAERLRRIGYESKAYLDLDPAGIVGDDYRSVVCILERAASPRPS